MEDHSSAPQPLQRLGFPTASLDSPPAVPHNLDQQEQAGIAAHLAYCHRLEQLGQEGQVGILESEDWEWKLGEAAAEESKIAVVEASWEMGCRTLALDRMTRGVRADIAVAEARWLEG